MHAIRLFIVPPVNAHTTCGCVGLPIPEIEVIGFQQIRRPNFDRHGVWLTMGNIELHLIKGIPVTEKGQHPADLIVPHISIETSNVLSGPCQARRYLYN